jgi:hypothetical protein
LSKDRIARFPEYETESDEHTYKESIEEYEEFYRLPCESVNAVLLPIGHAFDCPRDLPFVKEFKANALMPLPAYPY